MATLRRKSAQQLVPIASGRIDVTAFGPGHLRISFGPDCEHREPRYQYDLVIGLEELLQLIGSVRGVDLAHRLAAVEGLELLRLARRAFENWRPPATDESWKEEARSAAGGDQSCKP